MSRAMLVIVFVLILGGCGGIPVKQFQPQVPLEIKVELAGKSLSEVPVYISDKVVFYDHNFPIDQKGGKGRWGRMLEEEEISPQAIEASKVFLRVFREEMQKKGVRLVEKSCSTCLEILVDFQFSRTEDILLIRRGSTAIATRLRIEYNNSLVLETSNTMNISFIPTNSIFFSDPQRKLSEVIAVRVINDMEKKWAGL